MRAVRTSSDGAAVAHSRVQGACVLWCGFVVSVRQLARLSCRFAGERGGK